MSYEACARCDKTITNEEQHHLCAECARTLLSCTATLPSNHDKRCSLRPGHQGPHATEDYTWTSHRFMNEEVGLMVPVRVKLRCNNAACSYEGWEVPIAGKTTVGKCRKCGHSWSTILAVEVADTRAADTVAELSKKYDVVAKEPMSSETVAPDAITWPENNVDGFISLRARAERVITNLVANRGKPEFLYGAHASSIVVDAMLEAYNAGCARAERACSCMESWKQIGTGKHQWWCKLSAEHRSVGIEAADLVYAIAKSIGASLDGVDTKIALGHVIVALEHARKEGGQQANPPPSDRFLDELERHRKAIEELMPAPPGTTEWMHALRDAVWFLLTVTHQP